MIHAFMSFFIVGNIYYWRVTRSKKLKGERGGVYKN